MDRQGFGVLGCVALAAAVVLALAVFAERAIVAAGLPYHFMHCSILAAALFAVAAVFGLSSRSTWTGRVAMVGGLVLGVLFVGYFFLVLVAFMMPR